MMGAASLERELAECIAACRATDRALRANRDPARWPELERQHAEAWQRRRAAQAAVSVRAGSDAAPHEAPGETKAACA